MIVSPTRPPSKPRTIVTSESTPGEGAAGLESPLVLSHVDSALALPKGRVAARVDLVQLSFLPSDVLLLHDPESDLALNGPRLCMHAAPASIVISAVVVHDGMVALVDRVHTGRWSQIGASTLDSRSNGCF